MCRECSFFRGRHYYLGTDEHYRGHIKLKKEVETKKGVLESENDSQLLNFNSIKKLCEPWSNGGNNRKCIPKIKVKVNYREDGTVRQYGYDEAKNWEWNDPKIVRTFSNIHIGSFDKLMDIMCYQEAKGAKEVEIFEAPWFLLA